MDTTQGLDLTVLGGETGNYEQMLKDNNGSVNNPVKDGNMDEDNILTGGGFDEVDEDPQ